MRSRIFPFAALAVSVATVASAAIVPQRNLDSVQIEATEVADGVYMLAGSGGNIGLSVGADGAFVVDDQFAPLADKIKAAIAAITDSDVKFVVNTHWHGDHTGGNESFGGAGAMIVAHRNVRKRLNPAEFPDLIGRSQQAPDTALPVVTFADEVTLYWNSEKIRVQHVANAHTDGDAIIWFTNANVVHMGDTFFNGTYPFVDVDSGGNLLGMIAAVEAVLTRANSDTKVIPGHGVLAEVADLRSYRDVLVLSRDRVRTLINDGMSLEQIIEAKPMADHDEAWGGGFIDPDRFLTTVYNSLTAS